MNILGISDNPHENGNTADAPDIRPEIYKINNDMRQSTEQFM
jgi:hypothetical protein